MHLERAYCVWSILWLYRAYLVIRSNAVNHATIERKPAKPGLHAHRAFLFQFKGLAYFLNTCMLINFEYICFSNADFFSYFFIQFLYFRDTV